MATLVGDIMEPDPVTVSEDTKVEDVVLTLQQARAARVCRSWTPATAAWAS